MDMWEYQYKILYFKSSNKSNELTLKLHLSKPFYLLNVMALLNIYFTHGKQTTLKKIFPPIPNAIFFVPNLPLLTPDPGVIPFPPSQRLSVGMATQETDSHSRGLQGPGQGGQGSQEEQKNQDHSSSQCGKVQLWVHLES